jgi:VWFA-related protein
MVLLTDGDDTESRIKLDRVLEEARTNEVTIYSIGLGVGGLSDARRALSRLSVETGGRAYFISKAEELHDVYATIAEELRTLYQVVYATENEKFDGRFMKIGVTVRGVEGGIDVRHRAGYLAAAASSR